MDKNGDFIDIKIIWKALHNQATPKEKEELEKWLLEAEGHQRYYENLNRYYKQDFTQNTLPEETDTAWRSVEQRIAPRKSGTFGRLIAIASVAASLVIAFVLFHDKQPSQMEAPIVGNENAIRPGSKKAVLILDNGKTLNLAENDTFQIKENGASLKNTGNKLEYTAATKSNEKLCFNTLKVPRGGEYYLVLADGTKVWLNSESTLRYPVKFLGDERRIELTGEAYFEVTKNKHKPFRVVSGTQIVTVLGTKFNISSYPEDSLTYTTLVEGHVNVALKDNPSVERSLVPNEQSSISRLDRQISIRAVDPSRYVAWKNGRFIFKDERLGDIMHTLSRWYDVQVIFSNQRAKDIQFTGNLERYSDFAGMLNMIEKTDEVKFIIKGNLVTIE
ncbi:iron dicitrate transporter FecR [Prolixibacter bellariivorans]|uniref:Iron dicitrate transporter FecR n=1 Tax=Prolixibacter bellariivorans TaxID=314319 RepID=A0A5M4AV40_9BACT|nr:FecR family protein [Prolixibacter bellariivorans]GET31391.1 iron dicitrate transporter FecR [Prolixibacter bellariivorans]